MRQPSPLLKFDAQNHVTYLCVKTRTLEFPLNNTQINTFLRLLVSLLVHWWVYPNI
jgi:hypothetical protein